MAEDIGGVWRTVGGRRIFIKDGQDLENAMKESGKFGNNNIKFNLNNNEIAKKIQPILENLKEEYKSPLKEVNSSTKIQEQGNVNMTGEVMEISTSKEETIYHEFAHTLINEKRTKLLGKNKEALEEIKKIERKYKKQKKEIDKKSLENDNYNRLEELKKIAINPDDTYFETNTDEFIAESFAMAKLGKTNSEYAYDVLKIIDKYYKK